MKKRERLTDIVFSFDERAEIHGYRVVGETIEFFGQNGELLTPAYAAIGSGYERDSGKFKSTVRVDVDPFNITASVPSWISQYDELYAVDTNTIELDGQTLCVTCCVVAEIKFDQNKWNGKIQLLDALVFCNPKLKPELVGWIDLIDRINRNGTARIGVVVDSELDRIPAINRRKRQIADGFLLPENVTLIYASSERDRNLPFNFMIAQCDSDATLLIDKIKGDRTRLKSLVTSNAELYESSYYWRPKKGQKA